MLFPLKMKGKQRNQSVKYSILGSCRHCPTILWSTELCKGTIKQIHLVEEINSCNVDRKKG